MVMILPKEEIKYIFNPYILLPGDILLMNTYEERLRNKLGCQYEHAALYIGDGQLMEANGAHVVMTHIYSYAFREHNHACVLRLKNFSPITLQDIARNSRMQMGREYSARPFIHVRDYKNTDQRDTGNRSFCSRLVAQSYAMENVKIVPNADYCEPDDFLQSELLEQVPDAVVPFTEDLEKAVMSNQELREANEADNPVAELFQSLSKLYDQDIQDLTQFFLSAIRKPEYDEAAIEVIKSSSMFKHKEAVIRETPWLMKDEDFLKHYSDTDAAMHFLYSQMRQYDNTIIPDYKELHLQTIVITMYHPASKVAIFLRDYIRKIVDDAIEFRERLADVFVLMFNERKDEFVKFIKQYGLYADFEYVDKPTNISFIFHEMMKATARLNSH